MSAAPTTTTTTSSSDYKRSVLEKISRVDTELVAFILCLLALGLGLKMLIALVKEQHYVKLLKGWKSVMYRQCLIIRGFMGDCEELLVHAVYTISFLSSIYFRYPSAGKSGGRGRG